MAASTYGTGRDRLLVAARETFAEKGYRGATTRDIAARAGLTEPMIFRHFGSKAVLFEEAAVAPVVEFVDAYIEERLGEGTESIGSVELARDFFSRLAEVIGQNSDLLLAVVSAGRFDPDLADAVEKLHEATRRLTKLFDVTVHDEFIKRGLSSPDERALSRVIMSIVLAVGLHADLFELDEDDAVGRDRVLDEAARVVVEGVIPRD